MGSMEPRPYFHAQKTRTPFVALGDMVSFPQSAAEDFEAWKLCLHACKPFCRCQWTLLLVCVCVCVGRGLSSKVRLMADVLPVEPLACLRLSI